MTNQAQHQVQQQEATFSRWGNSTADSPLREVRIKAMILKEQAVWEKLPVLEMNNQVSSFKEQRRQHKAFDASLNASLTERMTCCLSMSSTPHRPVRSLENARAA
jgi:hypothetical protein